MEEFWERQGRFLSSLPDLKSILVVAAPYEGASTSRSLPEQHGRIARYAKGRDYHRVIEKRLKQLEAFLRKLCEEDHFPLRTLRTVDTSPLLERALAEMAGLGFFGKNTCLIQPKGGSFFFLATLCTNLELSYDEPITWDCGACTLCLQACPTQALVGPYELDARRCISYLTIELKTEVPQELRPLMGDWLFGCDICQEVCPYNRSRPEGLDRLEAAGRETSQARPWPEFSPAIGAGEGLPLVQLLACRTQEGFLGRFAGTPLMRAKRAGLLRNAAIAAGNLKEPRLLPALGKALLNDPSPMVRQHAAWALGKIGTGEALKTLEKAALAELEPAVLAEIQAQLKTPSKIEA